MPKFTANKVYDERRNSLIYFVYDNSSGVIVEEFDEEKMAESMAIHFQMNDVCQYCGSSLSVSKTEEGVLCSTCRKKYNEGMEFSGNRKAK